MARRDRRFITRAVHNFQFTLNVTFKRLCSQAILLTIGAIAEKQGKGRASSAHALHCKRSNVEQSIRSVYRNLIIGHLLNHKIHTKLSLSAP